MTENLSPLETTLVEHGFSCVYRSEPQEADLPPGQVQPQTILSYTTTAAEGQSPVTVTLIAPNREALESLTIDGIETSNIHPKPHELNIYLCPKLAQEQHHIDHLYFHGTGNTLSLGEKRLNLEKLALLESQLTHVHTTSGKAGHVRLLNSSMSYSQLPAAGETQDILAIYHSCLLNVVILDPDAFIDNSYIRGHSQEHPVQVADSLRRKTIKLDGRSKHPEDIALTVSEATPEGFVQNLYGQRIPYASFRGSDGELYVQLGCWLGTWKQAWELVDSSIENYPSYNPSAVMPDPHAARGRYQGLLKFIYNTDID